MALTPEEEKRLREEIREQLADRERRIRDSINKEEEERRKHIEDRIRAQIREEEEEKFFTERGYVKYVNRHGGVEWLTPEEAEKRQNKRRNKHKKSSSRYRSHRRKKIVQWATNIGIVVVALVVFQVLLKYNPIKSQRTGFLKIETNLPGAQIYVNGSEEQKFTPDTLSQIGAGNYFISVYKEGYASWPPMRRINVEAGKTAVASFTLKNTAKMGKVQIETNLPDYQLFVDGIPFAKTASQIEVPIGYRVITAIKDGYLTRPNHHRILINDDQVVRLQFQFERQKDIGYLQVSSNRSSAYIYLDDHLTGIKANSAVIPIKEGIYKVRLRENGFQSSPSEELFQVHPGEKHELLFNLQPESDQDTIQLITRKPGASIMVDGKWMPYVTPIRDLKLSEGGHFINLFRNGKLYAEKDVYLRLSKLDESKVVLDF